MAFNTRLNKLEANLQAKQRVLLWLEEAKAIGGWVQYWKLEIDRPVTSFTWLQQGEALFLYLLVNDINQSVLQDSVANRDLLWFATCSLHQFALGRTLCARERKSLQGWRTRLEGKLEETLTLQGSITFISETYFDSHQILFADVFQHLERDWSDLRKLAEAYNSVAKQFDEEIIGEESVCDSKVQKKVNILTTFARVQALPQDATHNLEAIALLRPIIAAG